MPSYLFLMHYPNAIMHFRIFSMPHSHQWYLHAFHPLLISIVPLLMPTIQFYNYQRRPKSSVAVIISLDMDSDTMQASSPSLCLQSVHEESGTLPHHMHNCFLETDDGRYLIITLTFIVLNEMKRDAHTFTYHITDARHHTHAYFHTACKYNLNN